MPRLNRLISIDAGFAELGFTRDIEADPALALAHGGFDWPSHVQSGADSVAAAARFLMVFQPIGAATFLRGQMERWTNNRATSIGLQRQEDESNAHFMDRVWAGAWEEPLSPGGFYRDFSELLHGRGPFAAQAVWEARELAMWEIPPDAALPSIAFPIAGGLILHQVTACLMDIARHAHRPDVEAWVRDWPSKTDPPEQVMLDRLWVGLLPLMPQQLTASIVSKLGAADEAYRQFLPRERHDPPWPGMTVLGFLARRYRAGQGAVHALSEEQRHLGADFNAQSLSGRDARYVIVGELAALVSQWVAGAPGEALAIASCALRSAFAIWLEDDSRAMVPVRTMLESVARARTWRLKPLRAAHLEGRTPATSPRDWLTAAGWRRLGVFNSALGELSHSEYTSRTFGALSALAAVQDPDAIRVDPLQTGRGEALDQSVHLLAAESMAWLRELDPDLASVVQVEALLPQDFDPGIESWMQRAWSNRKYDFGSATFWKADLDDLISRGISADDIILGRAPFHVVDD